ncbi:hypothetical protein [Chryseobacterium indologenes]|uniref:hypothetical protein n=1 Tax=Chryseobacterium indologenes TaxID=253 RepID=UPI00301A81B1
MKIITIILFAVLLELVRLDTASRDKRYCPSMVVVTWLKNPVNRTLYLSVRAPPEQISP